MKTFAIIFFSVYLLICGVLVPGYWFTAKSKRAKLKRGSERMRRDFEKLKNEKAVITANKEEFNRLIEKLKEAQDEIKHQQQILSEEKEEWEQKKAAIHEEMTAMTVKVMMLRDSANKAEKRLKIIEDAAQHRTEYQMNIEKAWEEQIELNNLPENITLRDRNRKSFFFYMIPLRKDTEHSMSFVSEAFGNALDAKRFRDSLVGVFGEKGYIRERDRRGEYEVLFENVDIEAARDFYNECNERLKFLNPAFDKAADNHDIISEEENLMNAVEIEGNYDTGEEYEEYVAQRLLSMGFANVALTPTSNDYGADVICEKDGVKYCVQCKMYSNPVGVSAVQEIVTAKAHYQCERAMVITNNVFTAQAKKLASENAVILVDEFT